MRVRTYQVLVPNEKGHLNALLVTHSDPTIVSQMLEADIAKKPVEKLVVLPFRLIPYDWENDAPHHPSRSAKSARQQKHEPPQVPVPTMPGMILVPGSKSVQ